MGFRYTPFKPAQVVSSKGVGSWSPQSGNKHRCPNTVFVLYPNDAHNDLVLQGKSGHGGDRLATPGAGGAATSQGWQAAVVSYTQHFKKLNKLINLLGLSIKRQAGTYLQVQIKLYNYNSRSKMIWERTVGWI